MIKFKTMRPLTKNEIVEDKKELQKWGISLGILA